MLLGFVLLSLFPRLLLAVWLGLGLVIKGFHYKLVAIALVSNLIVLSPVPLEMELWTAVVQIVRNVTTLHCDLTSNWSH